MSAYYNEIDPFSAQWLRNLIAAGHIAPGDVDERSIVDVRADDLRGYMQCHFFAGIGGWSYALRLAGWPDDRPVWTGSCPCQPFSAAGKGAAADDERHLWPAWFPLIAQCRPAIVFGEQVEAAIGWGWLDAVFADLEGAGYACGAAVLPACGVGAPHIRQRLWFVADAETSGCERSGLHLSQWRSRQAIPDVAGSSEVDELADSDIARRGEGRPSEAGDGRDAPRIESRGLRDAGGRLADSASKQMGLPGQPRPFGDANDSRPQGWSFDSGEYADQWLARAASESCDLGDTASNGERQPRLTEASERRPREIRRPSAWSNLEWLPCTDGKARPTKPGIFTLADGIPARVGKLRAAGNAIVPQVAAEFIRTISRWNGDRVRSLRWEQTLVTQT